MLLRREDGRIKKGGGGKDSGRRKEGRREGGREGGEEREGGDTIKILLNNREIIETELLKQSV